MRRSTPVAATSAIATAWAVSSVHSPGAKPPSPPPIIAGTRSAADVGELVAGAEGVAGGGGEEHAAGAVDLCGSEFHAASPSRDG